MPGFDDVDRYFARKSTFVQLECVDCGKPDESVVARDLYDDTGTNDNRPRCIKCYMKALGAARIPGVPPVEFDDYLVNPDYLG